MYTHNKRLLKISNFNCAQIEQTLTRNNNKKNKKKSKTAFKFKNRNGQTEKSRQVVQAK